MLYVVVVVNCALFYNVVPKSTVTGGLLKFVRTILSKRPNRIPSNVSKGNNAFERPALQKTLVSKAKLFLVFPDPQACCKLVLKKFVGKEARSVLLSSIQALVARLRRNDNFVVAQFFLRLFPCRAATPRKGPAEIKLIC